MNVGIIGLGRWGTNYLNTFTALQQNVKWVCAKHEDSLKETLEKTNSKANRTTLYNEILEDPTVDAVAIVTPGSTHYQITKDALISGKHVIVEKPLALNLKDAEELVQIAKKTKRVLAVGHLHKFNPAIQKIKEDINSGFFGKICYLQSIGTGNGPVRTDMSALWDFGPHEITILSHILGHYPLCISATGAAYLKEGIQDVITLNMQFPDGVFATTFGSWFYPIKRRELVVCGKESFAVYEDRLQRLTYYHQQNPKQVTFNNTKPLNEELKHFINCIEKNQVPLIDGEHGVQVIKILEAAEKSLKSNGEYITVNL